jgi:hypothetical protein
MITVFLSYSTKDYFFAELAEIKLEEAGIRLWRDQGDLMAGTDWRKGIENGIANCHAVLVALSNESSLSSYVTYEWAYAIGKGKPIIPLKLEDCAMHPKIETIQYLDFSVPSALPWESLIDRIREIETDITDLGIDNNINHSAVVSNEDEFLIKQVLGYLNQKGFQMVSFERLRKIIDPNLTDEKFQQIIDNNGMIFKAVTLKGNRKGLGKIVP